MSLITIRNSVAVNQSTSWSKGNNQCKSIWVAWHELFPMFHVPFFARKAVISHGPAGFILWRLFSAMLLATGSVPFSCLFICLHHLVLFVLCCSTYSVLVITVWTSHQECMHTLNSSHRLYAHGTAHTDYMHTEQLTQTTCTLWTAHTDCMLTLNNSHRMHTLNSSHRKHAQFEQLTQNACTVWTAHLEYMHTLNCSHIIRAQFQQLTQNTCTVSTADTECMHSLNSSSKVRQFF